MLLERFTGQEIREAFERMDGMSQDYFDAVLDLTDQETRDVLRMAIAGSLADLPLVARLVAASAVMDAFVGALVIAFSIVEHREVSSAA